MGRSCGPLSPLNRFTIFSKLLAEIRFTIWNLTLEPRVVEVVFEEQQGFHLKAVLPVALRVCRDSREAVMPHYPLSFGSYWFPAVTRFNFTLDTLLLTDQLQEDMPWFFSTMSRKELGQLRHIAIDLTMFEGQHFRIRPSYRFRDLPDKLLVADLKKAVNRVPQLKEILKVYPMHDRADNVHWLKTNPRGVVRFGRKFLAVFLRNPNSTLGNGGGGEEVRVFRQLGRFKDSTSIWSARRLSTGSTVSRLVTSPWPSHRL
jgi:hypothetical protein